MTTQCPKCGSERWVEHRKFWVDHERWYRCEACHAAWTDWQQSLIEQQQAEIDRLRGVLTSIADLQNTTDENIRLLIVKHLKLDHLAIWSAKEALRCAAEIARKGLEGK
jgi:transposase-like protein